MKKTYKYKLTLVTGETKEFESKYSPDELRISLSGFHHSYSLKAYGDILYGNVINYKLVETIEETTTVKELTDDLKSSGVGCAENLVSFMIVIPILYIVYKAVTGSFMDSINEIIACVIFIFVVVALYGVIIILYYYKKAAKEESNEKREENTISGTDSRNHQ